MIYEPLLFRLHSFIIIGFTHTKQNIVKQPAAKCARGCHLGRVSGVSIHRLSNFRPAATAKSLTMDGRGCFRYTYSIFLDIPS